VTSGDESDDDYHLPELFVSDNILTESCSVPV